MRSFVRSIDRHILPISGLITLFFSVSFLVAALVTRQTLPVADYLAWIRDGYDAWPGALWRQHNEHRVVIVRAIAYIDSVVWHGSYIFPVMVSEILYGCIFILLSIRACLSLGEADRKICALIVAGSAIMFFRGIGLWVVRSPLNSHFPFVAFFFIVSAVMVTSAWSRDRPGILVTALLGAELGAICSSANGVTTWPIIAILLFRATRWSRGTIVYVGAGAIETVIYLIGYRTPNQDANPLHSLAHPWALVHYLSAYFGFPWELGPINLSESVPVGAALTAATAIYLAVEAARGRIAPRSLDAFAGSILAFAIVTGVVTALGRVHLGWVQARSPRYMLFMELAQWAVFCIITPRVFRRIPAETRIGRTGAALIVIAILLIPRHIRAISGAVADHHQFEEWRQALLRDPDDQQVLKQIDGDPPNPPEAAQFVHFLKAHRIYGFR